MEIPFFQRVVIIVALVTLIICLTIIGLLLYYRRFDDKFPPVIAKCPDYWADESTSVEKGTICKNVQGLGNSGGTSCPGKGGTITFSNITHWHGKDGKCNKKKWATGCDVSWDGITNADACKGEASSDHFSFF
mgnify:CR=1 FL=1